MCGPILPYVKTVGKDGPGPISSLRANECPRTPSRGMDKIAIRGEVEHGGEELGVSEDEGHLGDFIRGIW